MLLSISGDFFSDNQGYTKVIQINFGLKFKVVHDAKNMLFNF